MSSLNVPSAQFLSLLGLHTGTGSFVLSSSRIESGSNSTNTLGWTWPPHMLNAFGGTIHWSALTLQRSTTASNRPNAFVLYAVGNNTLPAPDAHWTNVKQWLTYEDYHADNPNPSLGSYIDPWPTSNPVIYRLICNCGKGTDPVIPPFVEMTWDTALIIPVQPISAGPIPPANPGDPPPPGFRVSWSAPDVSWFPGNFLEFISYTRCPCAPTSCGTVNSNYNRIIVNSSSFTAPTTYSVEKSTDGVTFNQVVAAGNILNACNEWFDSGITTPAGKPWYYRFVAHTPDVGLIISNTIYAN